MDKAEEAKQNLICVYCGAQRVYGKEAEETIQKMAARSGDRAEAEAYVYGCEVYRECPTPQKHKKGMVPFEELEHEAYYHGHCRNARVARWDADKQRFTYVREKFGEVYTEPIFYWIEGQRFDGFKPYGKMEHPPFEIPLYQ